MRESKIKSERPEKKKSNPSEISFLDVITDKKTRRMLKKNFKNKKGTKIKKLRFSEFYDIIAEEFRLLLDNLTSEEEESFKSELFNLLSINFDDEISLNALEILTKEKGLNHSIEDIFKKIKSETEENKRRIINESILHEMDELKNILEKKKSDILKRESILSQREETLVKHENQLRSAIEGLYEKLLIKLDDVSQKRITELNKK